MKIQNSCIRNKGICTESALGDVMSLILPSMREKAGKDLELDSVFHPSADERKKVMMLVDLTSPHLFLTVVSSKSFHSSVQLEIPLKPLTLDLMDTSDLFSEWLSIVKRRPTEKYKEKNRRKTFSSKTLFCSCFVQNSSKDATDLAKIGPKFP
jgi:hypothetical protein